MTRFRTAKPRQMNDVFMSSSCEQTESMLRRLKMGCSRKTSEPCHTHIHQFVPFSHVKGPFVKVFANCGFPHDLQRDPKWSTMTELWCVWRNIINGFCTVCNVLGSLCSSGRRLSQSQRKNSFHFQADSNSVLLCDTAVCFSACP